MPFLLYCFAYCMHGECVVTSAYFIMCNIDIFDDNITVSIASMVAYIGTWMLFQ